MSNSIIKGHPPADNAVCRRCGLQKDKEFFCAAPTKRNGLHTYCKACARELKKEWHKNNPEVARASSRAAHLKIYFGLTVVEYDEMLEAQNGGCKICKEQIKDRRHSVDHDHSCCPGAKSCGKCIRGLLCGSCNISIGRMRDSPELLRAAADYLEEFRSFK